MWELRSVGINFPNAKSMLLTPTSCCRLSCLAGRVLVLVSCIQRHHFRFPVRLILGVETVGITWSLVLKMHDEHGDPLTSIATGHGLKIGISGTYLNDGKLTCGSSASRELEIQILKMRIQCKWPSLLLPASWWSVEQAPTRRYGHESGLRLYLEDGISLSNPVTGLSECATRGLS